RMSASLRFKVCRPLLDLAAAPGVVIESIGAVGTATRGGVGEATAPVDTLSAAVGAGGAFAANAPASVVASPRAVRGACANTASGSSINRARARRIIKVGSPRASSVQADAQCGGLAIASDHD